MCQFVDPDLSIGSASVTIDKSGVYEGRAIDKSGVYEGEAIDKSGSTKECVLSVI